jgi:hypothetical protein
MKRTNSWLRILLERTLLRVVALVLVCAPVFLLSGEAVFGMCGAKVLQPSVCEGVGGIVDAYMIGIWSSVATLILGATGIVLFVLGEVKRKLTSNAEKKQ